MAPADGGVFVSFRGKDVRHRFVTHLCSALRKERVRILIDEDFRRGRAIAGEIKRAVKEAEVSVVVFSKNYATSEWCLDELVLIMEAHESKGQILVPVYYHLGKSTVAEPRSADFAAAFAGYEKRLPKKATRWKAALRSAAGIGGNGHSVLTNRSEAVAEADIVRDVMEKMNTIHTSRAGHRGRIGMERRMRVVKHLLDAESNRICIIPIWGMGGIGKSRLAEDVYGRVCGQFHDRCVLRDFTSEQLQQELLSLKNKGYKNKNVLILLDGVTKPEQIEPLGELCDGFGVGTRIIVPTRNTSVFNRSELSFELRTYEVEPLTAAEAHQLLQFVTFDGCIPPNAYAGLVEGVVDYAGGNPLALNELGKFLYGRAGTQWGATLEKLTKFPRSDIHEVLMSSYDELDDEEQTIFLDVAFFFRGEKMEYVTDVLNACELDATNGIPALVERSLVFVKDGRLGIHGLHEAMAREIVRRESPKDPTLRSRLSNPKDILRVLDSNLGNEAVEARGLYMDLSSAAVSKVYLKPDVFSKMQNLKFIIFYNSACSGGCGDYGNVQALEGLDSFPPSLRLLRWHGYPLPYLPHTSNLLDLQLPCSAIQSNHVTFFDDD